MPLKNGNQPVGFDFCWKGFKVKRLKSEKYLCNLWEFLPIKTTCQSFIMTPILLLTNLFHQTYAFCLLCDEFFLTSKSLFSQHSTKLFWLKLIKEMPTKKIKDLPPCMHLDMKNKTWLEIDWRDTNLSFFPIMSIGASMFPLWYYPFGYHLCYIFMIYLLMWHVHQNKTQIQNCIVEKLFCVMDKHIFTTYKTNSLLCSWLFMVSTFNKTHKIQKRKK